MANGALAATETALGGPKPHTITDICCTSSRHTGHLGGARLLAQPVHTEWWPHGTSRAFAPLSMQTQQTSSVGPPAESPCPARPEPNTWAFGCTRAGCAAALPAAPVLAAGLRGAGGDRQHRRDKCHAASAQPAAPDHAASLQTLAPAITQGFASSSHNSGTSLQQ